MGMKFLINPGRNIIVFTLRKCYIKKYPEEKVMRIYGNAGYETG